MWKIFAKSKKAKEEPSFYKLVFDMDRIDKSIKNGTNTIFADESNLREIEACGLKKGCFDTIYMRDHNTIAEWPRVEFTYDSRASDLESEYLLNVATWPIVHKKVMVEFETNGIKGITYYPILLTDRITSKVNKNYYLMYTENFIDAYDMKKSKYIYNEKYNFYTFVPMQTYLNKEVCSNYDIFRPDKSRSKMYVSQKVRDIIERNNWVGFDFYNTK